MSLSAIDDGRAFLRIKASSVGLEYEYLLLERLRARGLAFQSEEDLRQEGFAKTPDILLRVPIEVDGMVINWIESKAMFGDEYTFRMHLRDQLQLYVNRFGSGLVIYWFDFLDRLQGMHESVMLLPTFPAEYRTMEDVS